MNTHTKGQISVLSVRCLQTGTCGRHMASFSFHDVLVSWLQCSLVRRGNRSISAASFLPALWERGWVCALLCEERGWVCAFSSHEPMTGKAGDSANSTADWLFIRLWSSDFYSVEDWWVSGFMLQIRKTPAIKHQFEKQKCVSWVSRLPARLLVGQLLHWWDTLARQFINSWLQYSCRKIFLLYFFFKDNKIF